MELEDAHDWRQQQDFFAYISLQGLGNLSLFGPSLSVSPLVSSSLYGRLQRFYTHLLRDTMENHVRSIVSGAVLIVAECRTKRAESPKQKLSLDVGLAGH